MSTTGFRRTLGPSAVVQVGGLLATLVVGVLLARGLGVHGYGQYGIAFAVITLLAVPVELGVPRIVMREVASAAGRGDVATLYGSIAWAQRVTTRASVAILAMAAIVLLVRFGAALPEIYLAMLVGLLLLPLGAAAAIRTNALMGLHQIVLGQLPTLLLRPWLFALLLFVLFRFRPGASPSDAMALNVLTAAAAALLADSLLRSRLPPRPKSTTEHGRRWFGSVVSMALIDGVRVVNVQIGIVLVGLLGSTIDAGLFRVASSAVVLVVLPLTLLETISAPHFARLFGINDRDELQRYSTRAAWLGLAGVGSVSLVILLFGRTLLGILFGPSFEPAYFPLLVLCGGQMISALFGMNSPLLLMTELERQLTRAVVIALLFNIGVAAALVPFLGATGAALGSLAYLLVWNVIAWRDGRRLLGVDTSLVSLFARVRP